MDLDFQTGALLLLIAAVVAMLTRRLRLPYSVGLVAAGIFLAVLPFAPKVSLTKDLIFTGLLPPLLFEAAFYIHWDRLRRDFPVIVVLASVGVALSACVTGLGMHYLEDWQWIDALVFGVLIAATDPVSVIATFKEAKVRGRLLVLIECESLFNDGTAAVAFGVLIALATGERLAPLDIAALLLKTICGGIAEHHHGGADLVVVRQVEAAHLGAVQPEVVQQPDDGAVPDRSRVVTVVELGQQRAIALGPWAARVPVRLRPQPSTSIAHATRPSVLANLTRLGRAARWRLTVLAASLRPRKRRLVMQGQFVRRAVPPARSWAAACSVLAEEQNLAKSRRSPAVASQCRRRSASKEGGQQAIGRGDGIGRDRRGGHSH